MSRLRARWLGVAGVAFWTSLTCAQTNGPLGLTWSGFDAGGVAGNGSLALSLTIGQPDAQTIAGGGLTIQGGFQAVPRQGAFAFNFADHFAERHAIAGPPTTFTGFNAGMTKELGEQNHAGNAGGKSIWWSWTAPASGPVTIHTLGSAFDTLLAVYTGNSLSNLLLVAANDDISTALKQSAVTFTAEAGVNYQIAVDGVDGAEGSVVLTVSPPLELICPGDVVVASFASLPLPNPQAVAVMNACEPVVKSFVSDLRVPKDCQTEFIRTYQVVDACQRTNTCTQRITVNQPPNDFYGQSIFLTGLPISTNGCNINATWQSPEFAADGHTIWWHWLAPKTGNVIVDTIGSSIDTALAITRNGIENVIEADFSSGGEGFSRVKLSAFAGTLYGIMVDSQDNWPGHIQLNITECPSPTFSGFTISQRVEADGIHVTVCAENPRGTGSLNFNWSSSDGFILNEFNNCCEVVFDPDNEGDNIVDLNLTDDCDGINQGTTVNTCAVCLTRGTPSLLAGPNGSTIKSVGVNTANCGTLSANTRWYRMLVTNATGPLTVSVENSPSDTRLAIFTGPFGSPIPFDCKPSVGRLTFNPTQPNYWIAVDPGNNDPSTLKLAAGFVPQIQSYGFTSSHTFEIFSSNAPAIPYQLEMTTNLAANPVHWTTVQITNASATAPYLLHLRDTNAINSVSRFYRLSSMP